MSSGSYANMSQQWSHPNLQLEQEYDNFSGFADSYQFNPDSFQSRGPQLTSTQFTQSPANHHGLYPQQNAFQNPNFLTADNREYHNNPTTYNFQAASLPTPITASSISRITANVGASRSSQQQPSSYYPSRPTAASQPSKAKRQRPEPVATNDKDDEMDAEMEEEGGARAKPPGACARCKNLKVKCEFKTETDPCKRCFNGGHECVTPGRKKRRTPPKREHLLNQIREQAAEIQKLMAQLEQTNARQAKPPNSAATDTFPLTPSSSSHGDLPSPVLSPSSSAPSSYFPSGSESKAESENNRAVEDWIAKARDSLAEFDEFIGIGGAGLQKSMLVKEDPEDSASDDNEDATVDSGEEPKEEEVEIEVFDSEGEDITNRGRENRTKDRQLSTSSSNGGTMVVNRRAVPKKRDSAGEKLATLPSEASPFGLIADLSLKQGSNDGSGDESAPALGVANSNFFRSSPTPDPMRSRPITSGPAAPHILTRGLITPQEAEKLFDIYFQRMNVSVSLLDPVLYTPQKTCYRSPFLFTVICAIASRFYTERPELYPQAMHYAQLAAGTALISGHKCVELCQGYILMSLYPVPAKRWEEERGWLYLGLAIRMATDLNLHLPNTAKPINEAHAREMLNRTRVWLNCFNLDRSTGSQYGKAPTISNNDYMANHSWDWWSSSEFNMRNFDIHICAYNSELKVMSAFMATVYSDPNHPTGLNKNLDFEALATKTDDELKQLMDQWRHALDGTDMTDPQSRFRRGLLNLAYSYARLVVLSFGFQHAFGKHNTDENPFLNRCLAAASDVVKAIVEDVGTPDLRIYLRHGPIAQTVFVTFAASMLVKLLQPKFASYLTTDKRQEIRDLVKQVIDLLASPDVSVDDKHGPNLYARFLKGILTAPPKESKRRPVRSNSGQSGERDPTASSYASPDTSHSFSPTPTTPALYDQFAQFNATMEPYLLPGHADSPPDFFPPPSLPYHQDPLQGMPSMTASWPDDFSWMSQMPGQEFVRADGMYSY